MKQERERALPQEPGSTQDDEQELQDELRDGEYLHHLHDENAESRKREKKRKSVRE